MNLQIEDFDIYIYQILDIQLHHGETDNGYAGLRVEGDEYEYRKFSTEEHIGKRKYALANMRKRAAIDMALELKRIRYVNPVNCTIKTCI